MPGQHEGETGKIKLLFAGLIGAAVFDRKVQCLLQIQDVRAHFPFPIRAKELGHFPVYRQTVKRKLVGLINGEMGIHVRHQRGFGLDDPIGRAVGGLAVIVRGAAGQHEQQPQPRQPPVSRQPINQGEHSDNGLVQQAGCSLFEPIPTTGS